MDLSKVLIRNSEVDNKSPILREALFLIKEGDIEIGKALLHEAGRRDESNAFIILGSLMEEENKLDQALNYFLKALHLGNEISHWHLGRLYFKKRYYTQAEKHLLLSISIGISEAQILLEKCKDSKDWDTFLFFIFGPFLLLVKREHELCFWFISLFIIVNATSFSSMSVTTFIMSYLFINLLFVNSYNESN